MPKRSSKPKDLNQLAASIVAQSTGQPSPKAKPRRKNPAAVALGRLGGLKGGPARAKKLTPDQLKQSALKAAQARWNHKAP